MAKLRKGIANPGMAEEQQRSVMLRNGIEERSPAWRWQSLAWQCGGLVMIGTEELRKGDEKRCYGMARTRTALRGHRYDTYRRATEKQGLVMIRVEKLRKSGAWYGNGIE
jgi:hypothetical protein